MIATRTTRHKVPGYGTQHKIQGKAYQKLGMADGTCDHPNGSIFFGKMPFGQKTLYTANNGV